MATTHYIDTSAPEIARARVKSLTQRVPEAFPVLVYGDTRDHNFVFFNSQTGSVESYSGNASYSLRVTLGEVQLGPTSGSYILTCGSSGTVNALADAVTVEAALNSLTTIIADGGVKVSGTFPNFLVTYNTVGVKTAFTADATSLVPASSVSLVVTATGSATVRQQTMIVLRQSAIVSQSTWSTITSPANGWTGTITTATAGALTLLSTFGEQVGDFIEATTVLTAEVLNNSGTPISYYQTPITIRAKNLDPSSSVSPPLTTYTLGDILYGKADGTLGRLAGNTSTTPAILTQTGTGVISAIPAWTATPLSVALGGTGAATLTSTALLLGAGTSAITPADLTYVSPTLSVPDAFVVSSAGSIGLTAGGSQKNITLRPTVTSASILHLNFNALPLASLPDGGSITVNQFRLDGMDNNPLRMYSYCYAQANLVGFKYANGTAALPTAAVLGSQMGNLSWEGYGATGYKGGASIRAYGEETFTDSTAKSGLVFLTTNTGSTSTASRMSIHGNGNISVGFNTSSGLNIDNANGLLQINSSSSTTGLALGARTAEVIYRTANDALRTDASWTVAKPLITVPSALTYASPTSVDVTLSSCYTVTTVNATGSVTFNATAGGTSGQVMTILIKNDATSAKTITFGTNFLSTGTLTASAASRHTSITFTSDGTSWYETGRAVLSA